MTNSFDIKNEGNGHTNFLFMFYSDLGSIGKKKTSKQVKINCKVVMGRKDIKNFVHP